MVSKGSVSVVQKYPNNLNRAIERSGMTIAEISEETRIGERTLYTYRAGEVPVPRDRRTALAECLGYSTEYLFPPLADLRADYVSISGNEDVKDFEVLFVLRKHCETHPTDENALQQLMELLGKVGRYREIERWYEQFVQALAQDVIGQEPDASTMKLLAQLRARSASLPIPEQATQTKEARAKEPDTDAHVSSALSGCEEPLPISRSSATHGQHIGETVWLTIAIASSELQALAQASPSEHSTPATASEPPLPASPNQQSLMPPSFQSVSPQGIILGAGANAHSPNAKNLRDSYLALSTDIVPSLRAYASLCQGELTTCRQQRDIYETIKQRRTMDNEQIINFSQITRRDLITLASISFPLVANIQRGVLTVGIIEEFLSEVTASVTTCWYLIQRNGGLNTVEATLPLYLPELVTVVKHSSRYRQRAAYLATQGFLLLGLVAHHRMHLAERIAHCQNAVTYAHQSGDLTLLAESLRHLGYAFRTNEQQGEALDAFLQLERYSRSTEIPRLLRSQALWGLSVTHAKRGESEAVIRFLDEARTTSTQPSDQPQVFLRAHRSSFDYVIILREGESSLNLGERAEQLGNADRAQKYYKEAAEKFGKIEQYPSSFFVPATTAAEIQVDRALAYAKAGDMDGFLTAFPKGVQLVNELGSEKSKQEARVALKEAIEQWPSDQRITDLWELL